LARIPNFTNVQNQWLHRERLIDGLVRDYFMGIPPPERTRYQEELEKGSSANWRRYPISLSNGTYTFDQLLNSHPAKPDQLEHVNNKIREHLGSTFRECAFQGNWAKGPVRVRYERHCRLPLEAYKREVESIDNDALNYLINLLDLYRDSQEDQDFGKFRQL